MRGIDPAFASMQDREPITFEPLSNAAMRRAFTLTPGVIERVCGRVPSKGRVEPDPIAAAAAQEEEEARGWEKQKESTWLASLYVQ